MICTCQDLLALFGSLHTSTDSVTNVKSASYKPNGVSPSADVVIDGSS